MKDFSRVEKIANAVLYEGYVLYPYRPSAVKNQQRFNFGVLYPREFCDLNPGSDAWEAQTECLVTGTPSISIEVRVRFLQMAVRQGSPDGAEWQEGIEREVDSPVCSLESVLEQSLLQSFTLDASSGDDAPRTEQIQGELELGASRLGEGVYRLTFRVRNRSILEGATSLRREVTRDEALLKSLVSAHSILRAADGSFISSMDPPERYRTASQECHNIGTWPVLAGEEGQTDLMLSSPIILYDYPQIAPESPGDLCDGLEIDEILALRILTLTDEEKQEVREGDDRARRILERTEMLPPEHFQKLHGALRGLREPAGETR